jgi:hypothetical protein
VYDEFPDYGYYYEWPLDPLYDGFGVAKLTKSLVAAVYERRYFVDLRKPALIERRYSRRSGSCAFADSFT